MKSGARVIPRSCTTHTRESAGGPNSKIIKWHGGGFDNLRKYGKETGQGPRKRRRYEHRVEVAPELLVKCARCGLARFAHERSDGLVPDHPFVKAEEPMQ